MIKYLAAGGRPLKWARLGLRVHLLCPDIAFFESRPCQEDQGLKDELLIGLGRSWVTLTTCQHLIPVLRSISIQQGGREGREEILRRWTAYLQTAWLISCPCPVSHEALTDWLQSWCLTVSGPLQTPLDVQDAGPGFVQDPHRMRLEKPQSQITITLAGRVSALLPANQSRVMWCGDQWEAEARPSSTHPSYLSCGHLSSAD